MLSLLSKPQVFAAPNCVKPCTISKQQRVGRCVCGSCLQTGWLNTNSPMKSEEGIGCKILQVCKLYILCRLEKGQLQVVTSLASPRDHPDVHSNNNRSQTKCWLLSLELVLMLKLSYSQFFFEGNAISFHLKKTQPTRYYFRLRIKFSPFVSPAGQH